MSNQTHEIHGVAGASPLIPPAKAPSEASIESPKVVSLEGLRAKMTAREKPDISRLSQFFHQGTDETFYIGAMSSAGYGAVENVAQFAPAGTAIAGQKISDHKTDDLNRDLAYLMHAVWLMESGGELKRLERPDALALLQTDGCGPSNRALINGIKRLNPPREHLSHEVAVMFAACQTSLILLELMFDLGLEHILLDGIAAPDERQMAEHGLNQGRDALQSLRPLLNTQTAARTLGITLKDAT
jgi:hypothetical protein